MDDRPRRAQALQRPGGLRRRLGVERLDQAVGDGVPGQRLGLLDGPGSPSSGRAVPAAERRSASRASTRASSYMVSAKALTVGSTRAARSISASSSSTGESVPAAKATSASLPPR